MGEGKEEMALEGMYKEMRQTPESLPPGWMVGDSEGPREELILSHAPTVEPLKMPE